MLHMEASGDVFLLIICPNIWQQIFNLKQTILNHNNWAENRQMAFLVYCQAEVDHSELNRKNISHNLLCLQLKSVKFGRSWVQILVTRSILHHQKMSNISQINLFTQLCQINSAKQSIKKILTEFRENVSAKTGFELTTFR